MSLSREKTFARPTRMPALQPSFNGKLKEKCDLGSRLAIECSQKSFAVEIWPTERFHSRDQ